MSTSTVPWRRSDGFVTVTTHVLIAHHMIYASQRIASLCGATVLEPASVYVVSASAMASDTRPIRLSRFRLSPSGGNDLVVARFPPVLGLTPNGLHPTGFLHAVPVGKQRAGLHYEGTSRHLLNSAGDPQRVQLCWVAVLRIRRSSVP